MKTKTLSKKAIREIKVGVVMGHEVNSHATMAAGLAQLCNVTKDRFMDQCSRCWDSIAASVQEYCDESIGDKDDGEDASQP